MEELISTSGYQAVERDTIYNIKAVARTEPRLVETPMSERLSAILAV